jgi:hypothetical protein
MKNKFRHENILIEEKNVCEARRLRLKQVREALGKSPQEIHALLGSSDVSVGSYYDLEDHDGALNTTISLGELCKLSSILGTRARFIFDGKLEDGRQISPSDLSARIKRHLENTATSITDFEDRVGFVIAPALEDPSEILNWNIDCLRFVSAEIGVNWLDALPIRSDT